MTRTIIKLALAAAAALAAAGAGASGAQAATTCKFANAVLEVHMTKDEDAASFSVAAGTIGVSSGSGGVACAGGTPTTGTTDAVLVIDDSDDSGEPPAIDGDTTVSVYDPADFAPGATPEADGASEIEFYADPNEGDDIFSVAASVGRPAQSMVAGNGGLSWTTDADADLRGMPFDTVYLGGGPHGDRLSGGPGRDRLSGGADRDSCGGGPGRDRLDCERATS